MISFDSISFQWEVRIKNGKNDMQLVVFVKDLPYVPEPDRQLVEKEVKDQIKQVFKIYNYEDK